MDFYDAIIRQASRIPDQLEHISTEEASKNALVLPLLNILGYNVFDPLEVVPEFTADVGTKKGEKVDYAIMRDGQPSLLIECKAVGSRLDLKHASQLFRYFATTEARFAILTNGVEYEFYTDIERPNRMDEKPFFNFSMLEMDRRVATELNKFSKERFDLQNILSTASDLKYRSQIEALLEKELEAPSEDFVRVFAKQLVEGPLTASVREQFTGLVREGFRSFVRQRVNLRLQNALDTEAVIVDEEIAPAQEDRGIETTEEELEAYYIVRAILSAQVDVERVAQRDTKSYFGVLLDDNNRRPLCRFHFNRSQKYLGLFDQNREEERVVINKLSDIYQHSARLLATLALYANGDS